MFYLVFVPIESKVFSFKSFVFFLKLTFYNKITPHSPQARNIEYKDPIEEEWEKFQKELKEETSVSAQIIAEDQEEAVTDRQIVEIDEQLKNWERYDYCLFFSFFLQAI